MKNIFIIHGFMGSNIENWFPYVKEKIDSKVEKVINPSIPNLNTDDIDRILREEFDLNQNEKIIILSSVLNFILNHQEDEKKIFDKSAKVLLWCIAKGSKVFEIVEVDSKDDADYKNDIFLYARRNGIIVLTSDEAFNQRLKSDGIETKLIPKITREEAEEKIKAMRKIKEIVKIDDATNDAVSKYEEALKYSNGKCCKISKPENRQKDKDTGFKHYRTADERKLPVGSEVKKRYTVLYAEYTKEGNIAFYAFRIISNDPNVPNAMITYKQILKKEENYNLKIHSGEYEKFIRGFLGGKI